MDFQFKTITPKKQMILARVENGMMMLHFRYIIHLHLKSRNVLLDFKPKEIDLGFSKFYDPISSKNQSLANCGTIPYIEPEVIERNYYSVKRRYLIFWHFNV